MMGINSTMSRIVDRAIAYGEQPDVYAPPSPHELHTMAMRYRSMVKVLEVLERWFDTDQEVLDAMDKDTLADHLRKLEMIRVELGK